MPQLKAVTDSPESRAFTRSDRFKASLIGWIGYFVISVIGRTVRWQSVGDSHLDEIHKSGHRAIFTFWHGRIFPATYYWRNRGIVVMTSMNRDGEAIAQCIRRFGYGAARGSSSRGGFRALAEMAREIRRGHDAAIHDRRTARTSVRRETRSGPSRVEDRRRRFLLSYFDETQDPTEELG